MYTCIYRNEDCNLTPYVYMYPPITYWYLLKSCKNAIQSLVKTIINLTFTTTPSVSYIYKHVSYINTSNGTKMSNLFRLAVFIMIM